MSDTRSNDIAASLAHSHNWRAIRRFIIFVSAALVVAVLLLWLYYKVMVPLAMGAFIAYFVSPWVDALERRRINRGIATALIIFVSLGVMALVIFRLGPLFYDQLRDLIYRVPALIDSLLKSAIGTLRDWVRDSGLRDTASLDRALRSFNLMEQALPRIQSAADRLWATGANIMGSLLGVVLTPLVAFYLVFEKPKTIILLRSSRREM